MNAQNWPRAANPIAARAPVTCGGCRRFRAYPDNPTASVGVCTHATRRPSSNEPLCWPNVPRHCNEHQPKESEA
jgi:hypothetical protein